MGTQYDSTTSGEWSYYITYADSDTTSTCGVTGTQIYTARVLPPRRALVKIPKHWKRSKIDNFAGLVNEETRTGWKVVAIVHVKKLYDKTAEKITMAEFKAMLLETASAEDASKINRFFARKKA